MKRGLLELSLASWSLGFALQHARQSVEQMERLGYDLTHESGTVLTDVETAIATLERAHRAIVASHAKTKYG